MSNDKRGMIAALRQLARLHGVHARYVDAAGRRQDASVDSLLAVLRALGVAVERPADAPSAVRAAEREVASRVVEPVQVVWEGRRGEVAFRLPTRARGAWLRCEWRLDDGECRRTEVRLDASAARRSDGPGGMARDTWRVPLPEELGTGCHQLVAECAGARFETWVFRAPMRCPRATPSRRDWGVFAPLYALHSGRSGGAGDLRDLADFVSWVGSQGGRFVGTLPLLPAFLGSPCDPSPYSPVSRLFWNEFYLDLGVVPELEACPAARRILDSGSWRRWQEAQKASALVDYPGQMAMKRRVLEALSGTFWRRSSPRRALLEAFVRSHPQVVDYARFRAVQEQRGGSWMAWPERLRSGHLAESDGDETRWRYHLYVQWLAHEQMAALSDHARREGVRLYLDMPLGTHRDGYDCWRHQGLFALEASGGAPPDPFFSRGQDWGFAPVHPGRSRETGHAYMRACLRHHLRHASLMRFDHVMGLHRLYWVPRGLGAQAGAYVGYPAEEHYALLSIEAHRHGAMIVGENLGTVPPEVDECLGRHGVFGMFVAQTELRPRPGRPLRRVPAGVVASLNTHDMPPFAAFWEGLDIGDRVALGLLSDEDAAREHRVRADVRRALVDLLRKRGLLKAGRAGVGAVMRALTAHLGGSAARWLLVNLEDLWLETASQNTPGTFTERVNWRRRARLSLEEIRVNRTVRSTLALLHRRRGGEVGR